MGLLWEAWFSGFQRRGRGEWRPECLWGGRRGESSAALGSISVNSGTSVECISSFCCLLPSPCPLPQRLHDFGAPTAFRTLDGGQWAISYGMSCRRGPEQHSFQGLWWGLEEWGILGFVPSQLPHPGFFVCKISRDIRSFGDNETPGLG